MWSADSLLYLHSMHTSSSIPISLISKLSFVGSLLSRARQLHSLTFKGTNLIQTVDVPLQRRFISSTAARRDAELKTPFAVRLHVHPLRSSDTGKFLQASFRTSISLASRPSLISLLQRPQKTTSSKVFEIRSASEQLTLMSIAASLRNLCSREYEPHQMSLQNLMSEPSYYILLI